MTLLLGGQNPFKMGSAFKGQNLFLGKQILYKLTTIRRDDKNENGRVAFPEYIIMLWVTLCLLVSRYNASQRL